MSLRRIAPALLGALLLAAALLAYAATRPDARDGAKLAANGCPPGYTSRLDRERQERRERLGTGVTAREEEPGRVAGRLECASRKQPEPQGELMAIQQHDAKRSTGGVTDRLKPGAYRAAVETRREIAADGRTLPGAAGTWKPAGTGPQINDDPRFGEVNGQGLADLNGRISDFAATPDGRRVFAAVGEGGVWETSDGGANWRSIGETLPTQAIGSVGFAPAKGSRPDTIVVSTGDSVFGGGGTFAGMGLYRTLDGGGSWQRATILGDGQVLDGVITFKVTVDPTNPDIVYAGTGAGLFRSTDGGATFANVALPTGKTDGKKDGEPLEPDCTGAPYTRLGCFQANMVTDVVVQGADNEQTADDSPGAKAGSVVAVVGWRAGQKKSPPNDAFPEGYVEAPNNGVYRSDDGTPGSFEKLDASGFTSQEAIGRIELGLADGAAQDHNYLYAIVEDAVKFNGGTRPIDISPETGPVPNNTVLDGIYVSDDFGDSWTQMASADELKDPTTGSALTGTACATLFCPGVQAWYNAWVKPDPTTQTAAGVPTRLTFGLEEIWQNRTRSQPQNGKTMFKVVGPYFSGETCLFLNAQPPACPTTAGDPVNPNTTTHPDQHAAIYLPAANPEDPVKLFVGHDGGVNVQDVPHNADVNPDGWGRGANQGFNTLLPYDAQVARDGTIYAGLQDNGELKIEPNGKQYGVFGGDGAFSAVDPDNSDVAYESFVFNDISKTTDGGRTFTATPPPEDSYQFINPFTMDPLQANHLITAGRAVHETLDGAENWETVFDLGTRTKPGDAEAEAGENDPNNSMSAIDVRSIPTGGTPGGGPAKQTADVPEYEGGGSTVPDPVNPTVGTGFDTPGSVDEKPFTIAPDEANASATIDIAWGSENDDWDLQVVRKEGEEQVEVGRSAQGGTTSERVVLTLPPAGDYVVRVKNFAATGTFKGKVTFKVAQGTQVGDASAAYAAFCGYCDALNTRPFANGVATNVTPDGKVGVKGKPDNWRIAKAQGLPERYVTSIQIDPTDPKVVYATVAGYSRRWLPVGVLGENADVSKGNVFKSTDAGETFRNISGNMPDVPANWTTIRNGQLVVATNVGTFISKDTDGGDYEVLGGGLPTAPVFTLELKPKASPSEPDTLIAATQGRGVYRYEFADPVKTPPGGGQPPANPPATTPPRTNPPGSDLGACLPSGGIRTVSVRGRGRGLRLGFTRRTKAPVNVDVFRVSTGRKVIRERLVARFRNRTGSLNWSGRGRKKVGPGYYFVRYQMNQNGRRIDARRLVVRFAGGKWSRRPDFFRRDRCDLVRRFKLERPVFGGPRQVTLKGAYQLTRPARVSVTISKGSKVVRRYKAASRQAGRTYRFSLPARKRARGDYRVRIRAAAPGQKTVTTTLTSRRL